MARRALLPRAMTFLRLMCWTGLVRNCARSWKLACPSRSVVTMDLPWWMLPFTSKTRPLLSRSRTLPDPPSFEYLGPAICINADVTLPRTKNGCLFFLKIFFYLFSRSVAPIIDQRGDVAACHLAFLARLQELTSKNILPMENAVQFYQARAKSFIHAADFTQMCGLAEVKNTLPAKANKAPSQREEARKRDPRTAISHNMLADFFSSLAQSSKEAEDLVRPFVSKLAANAGQLTADEFHALWLPFLRALLPILNSNQIPLDTPYCQELFSALLESYIDGYVGRQPARNTVLARARATGCSCHDCKSLNEFLASPTREVACFTVNKQRRMHLHQQLDKGRVDCTHETDRSGSPQTLVVTKTFWHIEKQRLDWAQRLMVAREQMRMFKKEELLQLLGAKYARIVNMEHLSDAAAVISGEPQTRARTRTTGSTSAPQSVPAGLKRKAPCDEIEIIDLTKD